ncbi:MAG TPA: hypothetical protein VFA27_15355 [Vicinamibacterales bacterium]|nr:hypothetical protein [Vicinamibacterales bacterium]
MTPETASSTLFDAACASLETALAAGARRAIVDEVRDAPTFGESFARLRDRFRSDGWIRELDRRTRAEGFHVLHDWDGKADHVNPDIIPIDVLAYVASLRRDASADAHAIAVLLDYYYFHLLSLLSVRVWDEGDADARVDRLQRLLDALQGADGSGQRFVADAETLLLVATSHYERHEDGYAQLLDRTRTLNAAHRLRVAVGHASSMGSHLRFGFEATYGRDTLVMRRDNVADYPWLCFALVTLMRAIDGGSDDPAIVEALLNGLSADARAFVGAPADALAPAEAERVEFRDRFIDHRDALLAAFEAYRPTVSTYSPLAFFFNFAHNIIKGTVVDALLDGRTWTPTFNDLLTARDTAASSADRIALATTLMAYARANPDRIRGVLTPVIVYDPRAGHAAFTVTLRKLRE